MSHPEHDIASNWWQHFHFLENTLWRNNANFTFILMVKKSCRYEEEWRDIERRDRERWRGEESDEGRKSHNTEWITTLKRNWSMAECRRLCSFSDILFLISLLIIFCHGWTQFSVSCELDIHKWGHNLSWTEWQQRENSSIGVPGACYSPPHSWRHCVQHEQVRHGTSTKHNSDNHMANIYLFKNPFGVIL